MEQKMPNPPAPEALDWTKKHVYHCLNYCLLFFIYFKLVFFNCLNVGKIKRACLGLW
jgi:hypothetical protein